MSKKNKKQKKAEANEAGAKAEIDESAQNGSEVGNGAEAEADAAGPEGEVETVQALKDRLQRLAAEYHNFRKQADKRSVDSRRFVKRDLVQQLLPVVDNFGHAMQALDQGQDAQNVLFGVKMIHEMLGKFLEENGIVAIRAVGEDFDPSLHEAVSREESDAARENEVLSEVQRGYRMGDLVVRHARVVVAAPKEDGAEDSKTEDGPQESE